MSSKFKLAEGKEKKSLIDDVKKINWEYWLNRPYSLFMATVFWEGINEEYFSRTGFPNIAPNSALYQFPDIYCDERFSKDGAAFFKSYFKKHRMSDLSKALDSLHKHHIKKLKETTTERNKSVPEKTTLL